MMVLGLTGSIGMGKSTAAAMLEKLGVPVHDADRAVHALLQEGSPAWPAILAAFPPSKMPQIYTKGGRPIHINRAALGKLVFHDEHARETLESILHPFVRDSQNAFVQGHKERGRKIVALDIPLLFETGAEARVDKTITITAPEFVQRRRVLARAGMDETKFKAILARQMPDSQKCARSDFVVQSGLGKAHMMHALRGILDIVKFV